MYKEELFVLASSNIKSKGIKKGLIVNEEEATNAIKETFRIVEDILGIKLTRVILTVPSYSATFVKSEGYTTISRDDKT